MTAPGSDQPMETTMTVHQPDLEALGDHDYLVRFAKGEDTVVVRIYADPAVVACIGRDEQRVVEATARPTSDSAGRASPACGLVGDLPVQEPSEDVEPGVALQCLLPQTRSRRTGWVRGILGVMLLPRLKGRKYVSLPGHPSDRARPTGAGGLDRSTAVDNPPCRCRP